MAHEFIDLKGFLFLVLITIPQTFSTNIDCGGKPFHCLNTTHFMICVDLGGGVSSTIDDFIIPCPPTTVCEKNNRFECEFPKIEAFTTDLNIIGVFNRYDKSADDKTIPPDIRTIVLPLPENTTVTELPTKDKSSFNNEILENIKEEFTGGNEKFFDEDIIALSSVVSLKNKTNETSFVSPDKEKIITTTDKYPHTNANTSTNGVVSASQTDISILKDNKNNTDATSSVSPDIEKLITTTDKYPHTNANTSTNGVVSASQTDISILKDNKNNTDETSSVSPDIEIFMTTTDKYPHANANTSTNGVVSASQTDISILKDNKNNTDETSFVSLDIEKFITTTDKYPHTNANTSTNGVVSASQTDIPILKDNKNNTDETSFVSPDIEKLITTTDKYPHTNANTSTNGVVSASQTDISILKDNKNNTDATSSVSPDIETFITTTDKYPHTNANTSTDKYPHTNANTSTNGVVSASQTDIPILKDNKNKTDETSFVSPDIETFITTTDKYPHTNANTSTNGVVSASQTDIPILKENKNNTDETSFVSLDIEKNITTTDKYPHTNANTSTNEVVSASQTDIPILKDNKNNTDETSFVSPDIETFINTTDIYPHTNANTSTNGVVSASQTDISILKDNKNNTDETSFVSPDIEKSITTTDKYPHTNANTTTNGVVSDSQTDIPILKDTKNNTDETSFVSPDIEKSITTTDKYPHTNANTSTNGVVSASRIDTPILKDNTDETSFVSPDIEKSITTIDKYPHSNANTSTNGVVSASRTDIPTLKDNENNTDKTSFVSPNKEKLITTTDKYPHINVNSSTNGVVSASRTDIPAFKDNITYTEEFKTGKNNNTGNKFNTTKLIVQLYVNELNQTIDKFIGPAELTTSLPNSSVSITRIYNIDVDPDNSSSIYQSQNLDLQKKIFKTVSISRNVSHLTTETLSTSEKVVAMSSKYNATDIVDNHIALNGLTFKSNTAAKNYSVEPTTEKLRTDDAYSPTLQSVTANLIGISTINMTSNTSGKDLSKLNETDTFTEGLIILNKLYNSNKNNTTNKIDKNNINELNRTSDKFFKKLNSTSSQDLFNVSGKLELQQEEHNPDVIPVTVSEMIVDTLSTTNPGLVTSIKYNGNDNVDNVIVSEAMVRSSLPVKANSTVTNYIVKSVSEVLKNDDEYKDVFKPVTASPAEKSTEYSPLSYDSGTTNPNIIFAEVTNIDRTSYSSTNVKQSVLESLFTNDSNNTMQDSDGFTFKMKTPHTLVNDDNKIGFKGDIEIKRKENDSILNDSKIKFGINKTKEDYFPTEGNIDHMINHNIKPTAFLRTLNNSNQTSATEPPIKSIDGQLISTGDNYTHKLNAFVENEVQSVALQESISYYTRTIEKPKTIASPLVNNLTTFGEISLGIEPTTTIDFIQQQSNHMVPIHNVSMDLEVESSSALPTITSININVTNKATQNTIPVLQSEAVTYSDDNNNHQDTTIGKGKDISIATADISKTQKTIESNDIIFKTLGTGTNSRVDTDEYQLSTANNTAASGQVSNLSILQNSVNLTLLTGQKDDITLVPLENVTANMEEHKQNIMETTTELDGTSRYSPITESVTESIYLTNMSAGTPSSNDVRVSTQTVIEYTKEESTLNDKEGNAITSRSEIYAGLLNGTAKSLFHTLRKTNESNRVPTALVTDVTQDTHLSLNNEGKPRNNITTATVIDIIESDTSFGGSKLPTSNATTKKSPIIRVNRILPSMTGGVIQHNTNVLDNVGRQIVSSDVTLSTQEAIAHELDGISALSTPVVVTAKKQPDIVVYRILSSTMASIGQYNKDELAKIEKQIVNSNIANSTEQIVINELDSISTVPTPNEAMVEKQPSILVNRVLSSTMTSISQAKTDELAKVETPTKRFSYLNSKSILPTPTVSTAEVEPNITVNRILLSTMASISQPNIDDMGNLKRPIVNLNTLESTRQVANNLLTPSILLTPSESTAQKESNITVNGILPSIRTSISLLNTDEFDKVQIQVESSNVTQTTEQSVDSNLYSTSILPTSKESIAEKQHNITVNVIALNTLVPISQNNIDDAVKFRTQIASSKVTQNTQQIIGNDFDKTGFNIVTEPAAIVETIKDTHNIVERPILSDMILSDVILMNETTNLKSLNQSNIGMLKKITEKATVYEKLQNTTLLRNASNDLNKTEEDREGLNFEVVNGTFVDKKINIELSGTHDNEKSAENYESSPSTSFNMKSINTAAMGIGRPGFMSKKFSDLTLNITLLNKMKYIYNSTNNTEAKVKNLTGYNILSKQQIKQLNGFAVSQISNINISYTPTNQMSNKSNFITVIHLLASANVKNPPTTINAKKENNTPITVDCLKLPRGKYADSKDCRKFYICVGKLQPTVGTCPNNTVFSDINKHCTKNLSHCVRNNQFHCLYEGRFSDFLRDNIYYICVKNKLNGFLRYKLQCQNGYNLNKAIVKCEKNEIWNQSDTSVSNSSSVSNRNRSVSNSDVSESSGNGEFECKKEGKFPYPKNCRKYYVCTKNSKAEYRRKIKSCSSEEIFDKKKKKCVSSDSEES